MLWIQQLQVILYTGYFIALKQQGKTARECMQIATKASAITVTRKGAAVAIPQARRSILIRLSKFNII